ncbi:mitochondrial ribosomal protein L37-domain-containing protein [Rhodotorula diobovata]|uniref:Large ribosomal subunit protein mL54 n=1 Tax=Rhodotorula diobovata TaxID=5288 RepID=A0A5C5G012_9BASI|nr:mitochondrial ribosomal protein L37-domain-containing protein [Rhodotorula diobovata]
MSCTCRSALTALRQPARRISQPTFAVLSPTRSLSSSSLLADAKPASSTRSSSSPASSCPAGTVLKGLNYLKDGQDPVALEDSEYPSWVFTMPANKEPSLAKGKDNAAAELRKQRADLKKRTKADIKAANDLKG